MANQIARRVILSPRSGRKHVAQGKSAQPWVSIGPVILSPRSGREHLAQGKSAQPWVSIGPVILSPRSGREHLAQGKSAQPWVSIGPVILSPRSGRQRSRRDIDHPRSFCRPLRGLATATRIPRAARTCPGLHAFARYAGL